ncbi:hypothetical protein C8Q76DRAFT_797558 [Earliella scabrosa]|nr:hypothetical protein C8Q76DRAFT_797558 [Earliella scabrosa]
MSAGSSTRVALALVRGFPRTIQDIVNCLDKELDRQVLQWLIMSSPTTDSLTFSIRHQYLLPTDVTRWSTILIARSQCRYDTFQTATAFELARQRATLLVLYSRPSDKPGEELPRRLDALVTELTTSLASTNNIWHRFRELYHPFIGQSENDRLECIKNLYPQLEDGQKELEQNVPVIVALNSRWKPYFELALTETGCMGYTETLETRKAWITVTLPDRLASITDSVQQLTEARAELVQDTTALWDEHYDSWFTRETSHVPTSELCMAISEYTDILGMSGKSHYL